MIKIEMTKIVILFSGLRVVFFMRKQQLYADFVPGNIV
jgi:hypothetical protein